MLETLRDHGMANPRVLSAMAAVPRHCFVPEDLQQQAYADRALPIGERQTISQPLMVARMVELLELTANARVLEVGTGSGYAAAVLAQLAAEVVSIERIPSLANRARATLAELGYGRVQVVAGDGTQGYAPAAPYQGIIVAAATAEVPPALVEQLADGGRLVLPLGPPNLQRLTRLIRHGDTCTREVFDAVIFVPLIAPSDHDNGPT
jgi:protein-L-isoaspartate(D-aspartate) O-methyltransferase